MKSRTKKKYKNRNLKCKYYHISNNSFEQYCTLKSNCFIDIEFDENVCKNCKKYCPSKSGMKDCNIWKRIAKKEWQREVQ